ARSASVTACLVSERARDPCLADAGRPGDQDVELALEVLAAGELPHEAFVETAAVTIIDVFDAGVLAQACEAQARLQPPVATLGHLPIDEEPEPLLEAQGAEVIRAQLLGERAVHAGELELEQLVEDRMGQHRACL